MATNLSVIASRMNVQEWLAIERQRHADPKWHEGDNAAVGLAHMRADTDWWFDYVRNYLHRAELIGLAFQSGRQLLGKSVVTATAALETAVQVYGPMPAPGHPSGEIQEWMR